MATGLAVIPVTAQIHLQSQRAVGGGTILAVFIWRSNKVVTMHVIYDFFGPIAHFWLLKCFGYYLSAYLRISSPPN